MCYIYPVTCGTDQQSRVDGHACGEELDWAPTLYSTEQLFVVTIRSPPSTAVSQLLTFPSLSHSLHPPPHTQRSTARHHITAAAPHWMSKQNKEN